jgi:tetratricopeptide (TPR) repeat protein
MAAVAELKYRAFLSYSHSDSRAARLLHARLENFRIDRDLAGRITSMGAIPKRLRPIFRDRHDFDAGGALGAQTIAALDEAAAMILLASRASARSRPVNDEVRLYRSRHPNRPLIPVIVDGVPGDPKQNCFPPALLDAGNILAADLRDSGDGRELALAKVVARLLGLTPDEVFRRAERERRRRARLRNAVLGLLAFLVLAATASAVYAWQQLKTNEAFLDATLRTATRIVDTAVRQADNYGVPRRATIELLSQAERLFADMARLGRPTPELRYRKAWMLIEFARSYAVVGDTVKEEARALEARGLVAGLATARPKDPDYQYSLSVAHQEVGDVLVRRGNLREALQSYRDGLTIIERLARADPANTGWQRSLSVSHKKIGRVLSAQGDLREAMRSDRDGLAIIERLADADPGNAEWQRDLAEWYKDISVVLLLQRDLKGATRFNLDSLAIHKRLARADANNEVWQHDLAESYQAAGDLLGVQGNLPEALQSYRDGLTIIERLARADPSNALRQYDLAEFHEKIGDVQGDLPEALQSYRDGLAIIERLARDDPKRNWQFDLLRLHEKIAVLLEGRGDLPEAVRAYRDSFAIAEQRAPANPDDAGWQRNLALAHSHFATALLKTGEVREAREHFEAGRAIIARLVAQHPSDLLGWERNLLAEFDAQLAALK